MSISTIFYVSICKIDISFSTDFTSDDENKLTNRNFINNYLNMCLPKIYPDEITYSVLMVDSFV